MMRALTPLGFLSFFFLMACPQSSHAQNIKPKQIKRRVTAPPQLAPDKVIKPIGCLRRARWGDEEVPCDAFHRKNAEYLRPIVRDIPAALAALNDYQSSRDNAKLGAYTGSLGLFVALTGWIISTQISDIETSNKIRSYTTFGGLSLTMGSVVYSLAALSASESHLDRAVLEYNNARPSKPLSIIEIKTRIFF